MRRWIGLAGLVACSLYIGVRPVVVGGESRVSFLAVGQGDCVVFQDRGKVVLVDVGPRVDGFDGGERLVVPELRRLGVRKIDLIILTHNDRDHVGGLESVKRAFPIGKVLHGEGFAEGGVRGWNRVKVGRIEGVLFPPSSGENDNESSVAVKLGVGGADVVLTGDGGMDYERGLLDIGDWSGDLMKAGHHGSKFSSSERFLNEVGARDVVVTCGRGNGFGHPAAEVVGRVEAVGARLWRTDRDGTVSFTLVGGQWNFKER